MVERKLSLLFRKTDRKTPQRNGSCWKRVVRLGTLFPFLFTAAWGQPDTLRIPFWIQADVASSGQPISPEEIKVQLGLEPGQVRQVLGPDDGTLLLLIADLSGSLTSAQLAKTALKNNLEELPPNVQVALLRAQDGLRVLVDPSPDRSPLLAAIESLQVSGRAGLLETIPLAVRLGDAILSKAAVRVAVLYITDSEVSNYREDFTNPTINRSDSGDLSRRFRDGLIRDRVARLDASLAATQTPVFIVHLNYRTDALNEAYQTGLMTLASATGGSAWFCRSQPEIGAAVTDAFRAVTSHYSLIVDLPAEPVPKSLEVILESPGRTLAWRSRFTFNNQ